MRTHKFTLVLLLLFSTLSVFAQRFQKEYTHPQTVYPYRMVETNTRYVVKSTGSSTAFFDLSVDKAGNNPVFEVYPHVFDFINNRFAVREDQSVLGYYLQDNDSILLRYYDPNGALLWQAGEKYDADPSSLYVSCYLYNAIELSDGFIVMGVFGEVFSGGAYKNYIIAVKVDFSGNFIWQSKKQTTGVLDYIFDLEQVGNRIYFTWLDGGSAPINKSHLAWVGEDGQWPAQIENYTGFGNCLSIAPHPDGGLVGVGYTYANGHFDPAYGQAVSMDENSQVRWQKNGWPELDNLADLPNGGYYYPTRIIQDGTGWVMAGTMFPAGAPPFPFDSQIFIARLDDQGNIVQLRQYYTQQAVVATLNKATDGGILLGYYYQWGNPIGHLGIIKTDANLETYPNLITGNVYQDHNLSCAFEAGEGPLSGWLLQLSNPTDTIYSITDATGHYQLSSDTGAYSLHLQPINPYWEPCINPVAIYQPLEHVTDTVDFAVQPAVDCPLLEIDVSLPFTRRCFDNLMYVQYCNRGTEAAVPAQIQVILDPSFSLVEAEIPPLSVSGDTLYFSVDSVGVMDCGQFWIKVNIDCNTTAIGQTVCVSAQVYPDSICVPAPNWSGGQITVGGYCAQDSVVFWATNVGTQPTQPLDYIIIEDMVIWIEGTIPSLPPLGSDTIYLPAAGATYGLMIEQEPGFPFNGPAPFIGSPSAWVEACNWGGGGLFPGGFITQFMQEDGDPTYATDCSVLVGSYDPNDKHAIPEGVGPAHYILPGTPLEYLIRFQNTGTDTAFRVVIRDELSPLLDPLTLRVLSSSHPMRTDFIDGSAVHFTFDPIFLPDSNVNLAGSQGFVRFRIQPRAGAPEGSVIENQAAIYFDQNDPVMTNTWFHTINSHFLDGESSAPFPPAAAKAATVSPNPCRAGEVVFVEGGKGEGALFGSSGVVYATLELKDGRVKLPAGLPAGVYFLRLSDGAVRKLVLR